MEAVPSYAPSLVYQGCISYMDKNGRKKFRELISGKETFQSYFMESQLSKRILIYGLFISLLPLASMLQGTMLNVSLVRILIYGLLIYATLFVEKAN